jgi:hypothetical protein
MSRNASMPWTLLLASVLLCACAGGSEVCQRDVITGTEQCQTVGDDYGQAAATAAVATGAWVAVGCTVNGCKQPYICNEKSKQCEAKACKSDSDCGGYGCDAESGHCR